MQSLTKLKFLILIEFDKKFENFTVFSLLSRGSGLTLNTSWLFEFECQKKAILLVFFGKWFTMQKHLPGCPGDPGLKSDEITLEIKFKMLKKSNFTCPGEPLFPGGPRGPGPPNK